MRLSFFHFACLKNITSSARFRKSACTSKFSTKIDLLLNFLHQPGLCLLHQREGNHQDGSGASKAFQSMHDFSGFLPAFGGKLKHIIIGLLIDPCALPL